NHIIDAEIAGFGPAAAPPIITEAGEAGCGEAVAPQTEHEFGRPHKAPPIMRTTRQPAQQVFGTDDCQRKGLRGAVQGRADKDPARPDQGTEPGEERLAIGDVLDDCQREGNVETRAGGADLFDAGGAVVDREAARIGMGAGDIDCRGIGVDPGHRKAEPGHWLGDKAAAAADIEQGQAVERPEGTGVAAKGCEQLPPDEIEADGVYSMERAKAALGVPPAGAVRSEAIDVVRIYGVAE